MRRARLLAILNIVFLISGLACIAYGLRLSETLLETREGAFIGGVLIFLAGITGIFVATLFRRNTRLLGANLKQIAQAGQMCPLETIDSELEPLVQGVNEMIALAEQSVASAALKTKELEIELKVSSAQRQHAEAILYSISDAVVVTDPFDEIRLVNESAARVFDFELSKAMRSPVEKVLRDPTIVGLIREMRQSESSNGHRVIEHKMKTTAGDRTFKVTLSCVSDPTSQSETDIAVFGKVDRAPAGVVAVLHDMTREREVAQMKNDFVSNVSHELRTPLASIKAYIEMLIDGEAVDTKTQHEFYDVIQNEANRLSRLIDNILNISRIESGLVKIDKKPQSLMAILKRAIEVISPQCKTKNIRIIEQLTPAFYQTLADRDMLYQAVLNLLSNSVKYTPEGGTITVHATVDESRRCVISRITDTGVGIPPKDLPFVFDKFYRVQENNRMAKGTGLGLSLVKQIIETVHHGRIFVESQVGKGSCFGFELDLSE
jgi:two-component system, OmpR family, phosphate regulon sensor histidine kinase PhoR